MYPPSPCKERKEVFLQLFEKVWYSTTVRKEDGAYTCIFTSEDEIYNIQSHLNSDGIKILLIFFYSAPQSTEITISQTLNQTSNTSLGPVVVDHTYPPQVICFSIICGTSGETEKQALKEKCKL